MNALSSFADPAMLLYLLVGALAGFVIGVIPGLGGTGAVAVLLPFVFVLEPQQAMAMIIAAVAVVHTSDAVTSILLGIPGSASAATLLMDGHEMARRGQAARALSAGFLASMLGGLLGIVALTLAIPIARPLVMMLGSPELFMLAVLGISLTAMLSKGRMVMGLLAGVFGVVLAQIGSAPTAPEYRFTFGSLFLSDGLGLVAVALGIFGVAEVISLVAKREAISTVSSLGSGWTLGVKDVVRNWAHVLRGALTGILVGILPGVGATAGAWLAYGQAKATASEEDKEKFGKGDPRGVIAPSSADNSIEAGALIPTLLFGIPGAAPFALLLGALLIFGIEPGPRILTDNLDVVYVIIWSFALASIIGTALCFFLAGPLAKLSFIRFPLLAAAIIPLLFVSAFQEPLELPVFWTMLAVGIVGWIMKIYEVPRAPFLIGFVLAVPLERYYFMTANLYEFGEWFTRPFVLVLAACLLVPIVLGLVRWVRSPRRPRVPATAESAGASSPGASVADASVTDAASSSATVTDAASSSATPPSATPPSATPPSATHPPTRATASARSCDAAPTRTSTEALAPPSTGTLAEAGGRPDPLPEVPPRGALLVSIGFLLAFVAGFILAQPMSEAAGLFPRLATGLGVVLSLVAVGSDLARHRRLRGQTYDRAAWRTLLRETGISLLWILLFIALVFVFGMIVASAIFIPVFLWRVAGARLLTIVSYPLVFVAALLLLQQFAQIVMPQGYISFGI